MARYCAHTFVTIRQLDYRDAQPKAEVACLYCGQIRHISPVGDVSIVVEEGKVIKKPNVSHQTG